MREIKCDVNKRRLLVENSCEGVLNLRFHEFRFDPDMPARRELHSYSHEPTAFEAIIPASLMRETIEYGSNCFFSPTFQLKAVVQNSLSYIGQWHQYLSAGTLFSSRS